MLVIQQFELKFSIRIVGFVQGDGKKMLVIFWFIFNSLS